MLLRDFYSIVAYMNAQIYEKIYLIHIYLQITKIDAVFQKDYCGINYSRIDILTNVLIHFL